MPTAYFIILMLWLQVSFVIIHDRKLAKEVFRMYNTLRADRCHLGRWFEKEDDYYEQKMGHIQRLRYSGGGRYRGIC